MVGHLGFKMYWPLRGGGGEGGGWGWASGFPQAKPLAFEHLPKQDGYPRGKVIDSDDLTEKQGT